MRTIICLAVLLVASTQLSFTHPGANVQPQVKKAFKAPPAIVIHDNQVVPFAQLAFVPCANDGAGELVLIQGNLHIVSHITINGNNLSHKYHFQPQGAKGVGLTTGNTYHATGVTQGHFKGSFQNGQLEFTDINNFRIIGPGPDNNFLVHQNVHMTVNANGVVTANVDNSSVECR